MELDRILPTSANRALLFCSLLQQGTQFAVSHCMRRWQPQGQILYAINCGMTPYHSNVSNIDYSVDVNYGILTLHRSGLAYTAGESPSVQKNFLSGVCRSLAFGSVYTLRGCFLKLQEYFSSVFRAFSLSLSLLSLSLSRSPADLCFLLCRRQQRRFRRHSGRFSVLGPPHLQRLVRLLAADTHPRQIPRHRRIRRLGTGCVALSYYYYFFALLFFSFFFLDLFIRSLSILSEETLIRFLVFPLQATAAMSSVPVFST